MPTTEIDLDPPVIETILTDMSAGAVKLRLYRVATDLIDSGGYQIYSSNTRTGFAGVLGTDFSLLGTTVAQPAATVINVDQALTGLSTTRNVYLRALAVDNTTTPTIRSRWSNLAVWEKLSDRTVPIPTFPSVLRPGVGKLSGIVDSLADSDDVSGGLTWHEFMRRAALVQQDEILEALLDKMPEGTVWSIMRDPPGSLVDWFEYRVISDLLPETALQILEVRERVPFYRELADDARDRFFSSSRINLPGSPAVAVMSGRRRR